MSELRPKKLTVLILIGIAAACFAGTPQKWEDLPQPVRDTVLDNGGKAGMAVDRESDLTNGLATYEAGVKTKDGTIHDLVITADGKLVETKTDDAADAAAERAVRAAKVLKGVTFTHPRDMTNPYLPLSGVRQDILAGKEDGKPTRVERTAKPDVRKSFKLGEQTIDALVFEDRAYEDGKLVEVAIDYFAQDDAGTVYYLGEEVDEYSDGKITGHDGSWLVGTDTPAVGILFPARATMGLKWRSEDVSDKIGEVDEIISMSEKVTTPSGTYSNCIKVKETTTDGEIEYKYYARGIGVVRETPPDGDTLLVSHEVVAK